MSILDPKITVLMSVYNGENYLDEAINSILSQTFTDFEFLIIDDASTDQTLDILTRYKDARIRIIRNLCNIGLTKSLNKGIDSAKGEYIARMDADDISEPDRLLIQINFLEGHKEIGVCGSWMENIDCHGNLTGKVEFPLSSNVIKCHLLFYCCVAHPSVMFRKKIIKESNNYNPEFITAQDYDLWTRLITITEIENVPEYLIKYRVHGENRSRNLENLLKYDFKIRKMAIEKLLEHPLSPEEDVALSEWIKPNSKIHLNDISLIDMLISKIYKKFLLTNKLTQAELEEINLFFAYQAISLASLAKPMSKIAYLKFFIRGFRYHPAIIPVILKQGFTRLGQLKRGYSIVN